MGDHVVLHMDRLIAPQTAAMVQSSSSVPVPAAGCSAMDKADEERVVAVPEEEEPLTQLLECRICQDEDHIKNLETPCACSGSLKYAHRECVQRWCNEKGDTICEICHETYKSGYTAIPRPLDGITTIDISGGWAITGSQLDLDDPRILSMATTQHRFFETEYDEYSSTNASGVAFCRSAALILMALLLLRHALSITTDGDDDDSSYFSLFLLRVAGFLLPFYIIAWAISILNQRRQRREEAAALATAEVAFILQSGRGRSLQFTIAPESPATPHQDPHQ